VRDLAERRGLDGDVYQPAEDSRLLAETALEYVTPEDRVLDVGTGSGYVGATIATEVGARTVGRPVTHCRSTVPPSGSHSKK